MSLRTSKNLLSAFVSLLLGMQVACSSSGSGGTTTGNPLVEDTSASGAVAGAIGGALSSSASGGASEMKVMSTAATVSPLGGVCPTFATTGTGCATSGGTMWLNYSSCKFSGSTASFTGTQALIMSSGTASCGTFPHPGVNSTLKRQYVTASGSTTPSSLVRQSAAGTYLAIDNHTTNLSNFDSATLATIVNGGYGVSVSFNSVGARDQITFGHRVNVVGDFDQTVYGTLNITESSSGATSRSVSGTVTVYHNGLQVIGTSTLSGLVHSNTCCLPVSGSITTTFLAGTNVSPTALGSLYVGKTETLAFTACGEGRLTKYDGSIVNVSLNRCF
ncbi:MAG: hypothetical protein JSU04_11865 [Bdellovibrionales bacterium]|nr:hypothetical protein [Bdellovibrionales bacterium]